MGSRKIPNDKDSKKEESRISMSTNVHTPINESDIDDPMKKIDPKMAELINNEVINLLRLTVSLPNQNLFLSNNYSQIYTHINKNTTFFNEPPP